jgi:hypothetical protein
MLQADGDLMQNTRCTSHKEDDRYQHLDKCCELKEACERACRILTEGLKALENMNC